MKQFYFSKAKYDLRLKEYWAHAINFVGQAKKAPVWFPENGEMILTRENFPFCFERISYMCKKFSKEIDLPTKVKRWSSSSIPSCFIPTQFNSL